MSSANSSDTQRWDAIIKPYSQKDVERACLSFRAIPRKNGICRVR